jgi:hypothetical protein
MVDEGTEVFSWGDHRSGSHGTEEGAHGYIDRDWERKREIMDQYGKDERFRRRKRHLRDLVNI